MAQLHRCVYLFHTASIRHEARVASRIKGDEEQWVTHIFTVIADGNKITTYCWNDALHCIEVEINCLHSVCLVQPVISTIIYLKINK